MPPGSVCFLLLLCLLVRRSAAQCADLTCFGCTNPNDGGKAGCKWCGQGAGLANQCFVAANAEACPAEVPQDTDPQICQEAAAAPVASTACNANGRRTCDDVCGVGLVQECDCTIPSSPEAKCLEQGFFDDTAVAVAVFVGGAVYLMLLIGMIVYAVRSGGDDVVVIDKKTGKRVRATKPSGTISMPGLPAQVPASARQATGLQPDGLWHCEDTTCTRAYQTEAEMRHHVSMRHPALATLLGGSSARIDASSDLMQSAVFTPAVGEFPCGFCGKVYNFQSDLDQHTTLRHADAVFPGNTMSGGGAGGAGGWEGDTSWRDQF